MSVDSEHARATVGFASLLSLLSVVHFMAFLLDCMQPACEKRSMVELVCVDLDNT